ncbi:MAG: hypothetical protein HC802_13160, partial [Caldilineaceae bacterium]|nr:hypothetical protein [Caldilineaceae bacterium]
MPADDRRSSLVISEFMADNTSSLTDEDGDFSDWIEIHNQSPEVADLGGWSLTDDPTKPEKWSFGSLVLQPNERIVVFASGKDQPRIRTIEQDGEIELLHTNFKLNAEGGFLALYAPTARRYLDATALNYPPQIRDVSFGRYQEPAGEAGFGYLVEPTPGEANLAPTWKGAVEPVSFDVERGYYDQPFDVKLRSETEGAMIRYTVDGSDPSAETGAFYAGPIAISNTTVLRAAAFVPEYRPSPSTTQTYIFLDDVVAQPAQPDGFPETWGQHHISFAGYTEGEPRLADYEMDPDIVLDPTYGPQMRDALLALPTLSLVTDLSNLDIYAEPGKRGPESERPVSVELFYPDGSQPGFQINSGIRIQGGAGRWEFMPKHSFRLFFKRDYGPTTLSAQLFPDSPVSEFETLTLRAGVDRSYAGHPPAEGESANHRATTYTRDEWGRDAQIAVSGVGSHGIFVHLYLNGLYWGIYNVVERPDNAFAASYMGGVKEEWFSANHGGAVDGQMDRFNVLIQLAEEGGL